MKKDSSKHAKLLEEAETKQPEAKLHYLDYAKGSQELLAYYEKTCRYISILEAWPEFLMAGTITDQTPADFHKKWHQEMQLASSDAPERVRGLLKIYAEYNNPVKKILLDLNWTLQEMTQFQGLCLLKMTQVAQQMDVSGLLKEIKSIKEYNRQPETTQKFFRLFVQCLVLDIQKLSSAEASSTKSAALAYCYSVLAGLFRETGNMNAAVATINLAYSEVTQWFSASDPRTQAVLAKRRDIFAGALSSSGLSFVSSQSSSSSTSSSASYSGPTSGPSNQG